MKKFLKYFSLIILVIVIIFFSLGIFVPTLNYETRVTVNSPVEPSFRVFNSPFLLTAWIPGLKNVRWISGKQNEIGSKWAMTIEEGGNQYIMTEELVAFKENKLFVVKMENDDFTNDMEVRFMDKGTTSEICAYNKVTGKNIFLKSLLVFSKSTFTERDKEMYMRLKKIIEGSH